jgi:hypothetical protein
MHLEAASGGMVAVAETSERQYWLQCSASALVNNMTRCQLCQQVRPTKSVTFDRNVGMLVLRRMYRFSGQICKACTRQKF